ncbi:MAG TPA: K(+)-transporting ATPase subunit F [Thermoanaerobaculia bacterium]|nr:K(+)-transporting ATPase subunit F [Thermoanaerobaculia bacterium]
MNLLYLAAGLVALVLAVYLVVALFDPERFS